MIKIKTSELTRAALNWAVATAQGVSVEIHSSEAIHARRLRSLPTAEANALPRPEPYCSIPGVGVAEYDRNWAQGGPIIERELIPPIPEPNNSRWGAYHFSEDGHRSYAFGPTPLIAVMRCFVASKLGDEVEIPSELI